MIINEIQMQIARQELISFHDLGDENSPLTNRLLRLLRLSTRFVREFVSSKLIWLTLCDNSVIEAALCCTSTIGVGLGETRKLGVIRDLCSRSSCQTCEFLLVRSMFDINLKMPRSEQRSQITGIILGLLELNARELVYCLSRSH